MNDTCGKVALHIQTYYAGLNQVTHPNVITFDEPWNGYKYYMAYTPYPYANGSEENPCLACSNDLFNWEKPKGLINPIATCEEVECDELKDTHLVYREDLDRLEMWYLGRINSTMKLGGPLCGFRKVSYDGIHWSKYEVMYKDIAVCSPSIIWEENKYKFWGICHTSSKCELLYMESTDGTNWSKLERCNIPEVENTQMWHGSITKFDNNYQFVWVGNGKDTSQQIYFSDSIDGVHFSQYKIIIKNDTWKFLYRPCLIKIGNEYYCYYGVIRQDNQWFISLSYGSNLMSLSGITNADINDAILSLTKIEKIKLNIKKISNYVSIKLMILLPFIIFMYLLWYKNIMQIWLLSILLTSLLSYFLIYKNIKHAIKQGTLMGTSISVLSYFVASIVLVYFF